MESVCFTHLLNISSVYSWQMVQYFTTKNTYFLDWEILFHCLFIFYPCLLNLDSVYMSISLIDGCNINGDTYDFPLRYLRVDLRRY